ncbi:MAG: hypothetical protein V1914_02120 [archaeon]
MDKNNIGMYEIAYANVANYLQRELNVQKQKTRTLRNTPLDLMLSHLGIENSRIYFLDPLRVEIEEDIAYWGMLSLTPNYKNIFGAVFHYPLNTETKIEIICGLVLGYEKIRLILGYDIETKSGTEPYTWTSNLDFTHGGIEGILEQDSDLNLETIFEVLPDTYNLTKEFLEIVNAEIINYSAEDIFT